MPITIAMDIYVARQPIFNRKRKVIGHELFYRSGLTNSYGGTDGTNTFLAIIRNAFGRFREMKMAMLFAKKY